MAKVASRRIVVDASVVRAAGGEDATFPTSKHCRDFLKAIHTICHRVVMTPEIRDEWKRHMSRFSRKWRVSMEAKKKLCRIKPVPDDDLCAKILETGSGQGQQDALQKDLRLIEAALATDNSIAALDDTARRAFINAARSVREIRRIVWVNPAKTNEQPIDWLENGARIESTRQLHPTG